jgi:hypothetical protein
MSQQPELTLFPHDQPLAPVPETGSSSVPGSASGSASGFPQRHTPRRIPRWLERAELFLRVLLRMYIGVAVCYLPWSRSFWDQNPLFAHFPLLGAFAAHGAVRGLVSGLGLLNLWIAFHDALRRRDG